MYVAYITYAQHYPGGDTIENDSLIVASGSTVLNLKEDLSNVLSCDVSGVTIGDITESVASSNGYQPVDSTGNYNIDKVGLLFGITEIQTIEYLLNFRILFHMAEKHKRDIYTSSFIFAGNVSELVSQIYEHEVIQTDDLLVADVPAKDDLLKCLTEGQIIDYLCQSLDNQGDTWELYKVSRDKLVLLQRSKKHHSFMSYIPTPFSILNNS